MPWDDEITSLTELQLIWYRSQFHKDQEEEMDSNIAIAEYLASFINPKAVHELRNSKNNVKKADDASFIKSLKAISGTNKSDEEIRAGLRKR